MKQEKSKVRLQRGHLVKMNRNDIKYWRFKERDTGVPTVASRLREDLHALVVCGGRPARSYAQLRAAESGGAFYQYFRGRDMKEIRNLARIGRSRRI